MGEVISMGTITVRNLPESVIKKLKRRAGRNGHSMEQEVRDILTQETGDREEIFQRIKELRKKTGRVPGEQILQWIREGRERTR